MYSYILYVLPNFVYEDYFDKIKPFSKNHVYTILEINQILTYTIYKCREHLALEHNIIDDPLMDMCDFTQSYMGHLLESLNVFCIPNEARKTMPEYARHHSFLTACFNTTEGLKNYLIDVTYRQFFLLESCSKDKFLIINNRIKISPDLGYFMCKDLTKMEFASNLLYYGFIELTLDNAKLYGDGFVLEKRKGDINLLTKDTNISGERYLKSFLTNKSKYEFTADEIFNNKKNK